MLLRRKESKYIQGLGKDVGYFRDGTEFSLCCKDRTHGPGEDVEGKYPARSHDCMPPETEFANSFEDAQLDVERREKKQINGEP